MRFSFFVLALLLSVLAVEIRADDAVEELDELLDPISEEQPEEVEEIHFPGPEDNGEQTEEEYDDTPFQEAEASYDGMPVEMDYTYDYYMNLELIGKCRELTTSTCSSFVEDSNQFLHCLRSNATEFENACAKNIGCLTDETILCGPRAMIDKDSTEWAECILANQSNLRNKCPPTLVCEATTAKLCGRSLAVSHEAGHNCTADHKEQIETLCAPETHEPLGLNQGETGDVFEVMRASVVVGVECRNDLRNICNSTEGLKECIDANTQELQSMCSRTSECLSTQASLCPVTEPLRTQGACLVQNIDQIVPACNLTTQCETTVFNLCDDLTEAGLSSCLSQHFPHFNRTCLTFPEFMGHPPGPNFGEALPDGEIDDETQSIYDEQGEGQFDGEYDAEDSEDSFSDAPASPEEEELEEMERIIDQEDTQTSSENLFAQLPDNPIPQSDSTGEIPPAVDVEEIPATTDAKDREL